MVNMIIDGKQISAEENITIMELLRETGSRFRSSVT